MKKFITCAICAALAQYTLEELCEFLRYLSKRPIRRWMLKGTYFRLFGILLSKFDSSNSYDMSLRNEMKELSKTFIKRPGQLEDGYYLL